MIPEFHGDIFFPMNQWREFEFGKHRSFSLYSVLYAKLYSSVHHCMFSALFSFIWKPRNQDVINAIASLAEALLHSSPKQGASGPVLCADFRDLSWVSTKFVLTSEQMFPLNFSEP